MTGASGEVMCKLRPEGRSGLSQVRVNNGRKGFQAEGTVCAKAQSNGILVCPGETVYMEMEEGK